MRAFLIFFGLILAALAVMAALAYPAWLLLHPHFDFPFHRIAGRVGMLALLVGFILVARRMRVADRVSFGYGLPRREFLREMLKALVLGVVLMLPIVILMQLLGLRVWRADVTLDATMVLKLLASGLGAGLSVALIEESFLRGPMFTAIQRESGTWAAIVLTALVYSLTHFIARYRIPPEMVNASSGLDLLAGTFHMLANPLHIADAFLCLLAVGVVLGVVRAATGNIAACIGLHAGWVWVIQFVLKTSEPNRGTSLNFLLSDFDGMVGWLVLGWTILIGLVIHRCYYVKKPTIPGRRGDAPR